jgi:glycosyltransferase involved in cell wall biosynthesis
MAVLAERFASRLRLIALIHHPLALETGLAPATAERLRQCERRGLAAVSRVITTSSSTALGLAGYGVLPEHISVVCPGTDRAPLARGTCDHRVNLLCVATLTPRKGHALLFSALAPLRDRAWRLTCAGSTVRAPGTAESLRLQIDALGLGDRILLAGELADRALNACYDEADVFVLASQHEGYGMVLSEALARGLPIVATEAGAIPETVPADAALLVPTGGCEPLTAALGRIMDDHTLRARLADGARRARSRLTTWPEAVGQFEAAVRTACPHE